MHRFTGHLTKARKSNICTNIGSAISFAGIEPVTTSGFASLSIVTPSAADTLLIDKPATAQNCISGYSDATPLSPLTFFNISHVLIDTATNDAGAGDDSITISSDGMLAAGLTSLSVSAGTGNNTLTTHGGTTPLIATSGRFVDTTGESSVQP